MEVGAPGVVILMPVSERIRRGRANQGRHLKDEDNSARRPVAAAA